MKRARDVMMSATSAAARTLRHGHVYLVVEREYRRVGVPCVVTVGKTVDIVRRMSEYPRGTRIVSTDWVKDMDGMEKTIIREFTATFPRRRDLGLEYFQVAGSYGDGEGVGQARALFSRLVGAAPFGDLPYAEPEPVPVANGQQPPADVVVGAQARKVRRRTTAQGAGGADVAMPDAAHGDCPVA